MTEERLTEDQETEELRVYEIPEENVEWMTAKFAKLAKRAAKLGVEKPHLEISDLIREPITKKVDLLNSHDSHRLRMGLLQHDPEDASRAIMDWREYRVVKVFGEAPKYPGWTFIAKIEPSEVEGKNFVLVAPGQDEKADLEAYRRISMGHCDHCKTHRSRKAIFVVFKDETGEQFIVGRQCLKDFLGHQDPDNIVRWFQWILSLDETISERERMPREEKILPILGLLAITAAHIRIDGWMSRSRASQLGDELEWAPRATADAVSHHCFTDPSSYSDLRARQGFINWREERDGKDEDVEMGRKALDWILSQTPEPTQDYLWNCKLVAEGEWVKSKRFGLACSIMSSYQRQVEREIKTRKKNEEFAKSEHFGEVKKRETFTLTLKEEKRLETDWGTSHLLTFVDQDGNRAKWFSSNSAAWLKNKAKEQFDEDGMRNGVPGMVIEGTYEIKATVKKHDEWQGIKDTAISRGVILNTVNEPSEEDE